jgi:hypothetical protein
MQFVNPSFVQAPVTGTRAHDNSTHPLFKLDQNAALSGDVTAETNPATSPLNPGHPVLLASRAPSTQQMKDLKFLYDVALDNKPSATNLKIAKDFLIKWRPPKADMQFLKQASNKIIKDYVDNPNSRAAEYSKNWPSYSENEKKAIIIDFLNSMNKSLGTSFNLSLVNLPTINNNVFGGYYNHADNTIIMNMHPDVNKSFGQNIIVAMHEAAHGIFFNRVRGMNPKSIMEAVQKGSLSYTAGVTDANLYMNLYMTANKDGWMNYSLQPHEFFAHTLQHFGEIGLKSRGITSSPSLPTGHPILQHIKRLKL